MALKDVCFNFSPCYFKDIMEYIWFGWLLVTFLKARTRVANYIFDFN